MKKNRRLKARAKKECAINIPNILTAMRILLVPLFVILLIKNLFVPAFWIFTIAGISDGLDGFIARCFNQKTELGAYLDPIADKLLLASAYISLGIIKILPGWLAVIVISRDILILLGIAICSFADVKVKIKPSFVSKCTTLSQLLTVFMILLYYQNTAGAAVFRYSHLLYICTAVLTIISGLHYTYTGLNLLQAASKVNGHDK